ncbi:MAG: ligase-associated DNA damage response exonuclease [Moraxellaceae bacterium]|nr:ligase-associated DNA damage response exonuclease [Pseudobdellovibrionaceae bacterium]
MKDVIVLSKNGLYCPAGDFYIDPWKPIETSFITHAHSDHARSGAQKYYTSLRGLSLFKHRLKGYANAQDAVGVPFGKKIKINEAWVSFHSAGHILGSAQLRVEVKNKVWVASGDYKRTPDPSCDPFEVVRCDAFISEATFALPIYQWESGEVTAQKIKDWWHSDRSRPSILFCYSLGKAQRVLAELKKISDETVYLHGAAVGLTDIYRAEGIDMLQTLPVSEVPKDFDFAGCLILAPPSAHRSSWMKRFKEPQTAFGSGWMQVRGARRRGGYEKGFILSDHADWNELIQTIDETGAQKIILTHGREDVLARVLREKGLEVAHFTTEYSDEEIG